MDIDDKMRRAVMLSLPVREVYRSDDRGGPVSRVGGASGGVPPHLWPLVYKKPHPDAA